MKELGIGSRIQHPSYGEGVIFASRFRVYKVSFLEKGVQEIDKDDEIEVIESVNEGEYITVKDVQLMMTDILEKWADITEVVKLGERWYKGKLILQPFDEKLAPKEIPIETFFHKITMLRDRLRVLEQKINSHKNLNAEEKVDMQQYITRIYGSLTTFNVLFKYKEDYFVGQKSE
ncbi:hypothetical protein RCC89_20870 [Cytophagaceae bacterium ABcell3]|nr:hypothetical protein RCC89_20870 [Cytophagaceae bacterium ABcell3]